MTTSDAAAPTTSAEQPSTSASGQDANSSYECPFCVMMRKGGCEAPFKAFMDCGEKADKGDHEMAECVQYFEALHVCMEKNKAVFDELLVEMKAQEREGKDEQPQQQQEQPATANDSSAPAPAAAAAAATATTCSTDSGAHTKHSEDDTAPLEAAAAVASMAAGTQPAAA